MSGDGSASSAPTHKQRGTGYEKQHPRINKPDMFMNVALWMEWSPLAECPSRFCGPETRENVQRDDGQGTSEDHSDRGKPVTQESLPLKPKKEYNKAGAVFVLPNDRALSVDCSKGGVHAAVSALNKFGQERAKGCQVYLSRRPCMFCAKLLVQCEVSKVYYLPIEPELNDPDDVLGVDKLFKVQIISLNYFF
jgi:deoxycytidylate deaminase